jgi:translation elongation factor EF-Ts
LNVVGAIDIPTLLSTPTQDRKTLQEVLLDGITKIRENIVIRRAFNVDVSAGVLAGTYMHGKVSR